MKKLMLVLIAVCVLSSSLPNEAKAGQSYRFDLVENGMIGGTCQGPAGPERSRLKAVVGAAMGSYRQVTFKAYLCTRQYGFRESKIQVNVPEELFRHQWLSTLGNGASQIFSGVPSARTGAISSVALRKYGVVGAPIAGWRSYPKFEISWPAGDYAPFSVFLDNDGMGDVAGFRAGYHEPWRILQISYKHPQVPQAFVMIGYLREAGVE